MKMLRATMLTLGSCALAASMFSAAYMKLGDIKGEATDAAVQDGRKGTIDISSFSFGTSQAGAARDAGSGQATGKRDAASGLPTGKRQHKPFTITKPVDKATPILAKALASGESIGMIEVSDGTTIHRLHDCVITGIQTSPSSGGDRPMESISLNFTKVESMPDKSPAARAAVQAKDKAAKPARASN